MNQYLRFWTLLLFRAAWMPTNTAGFVHHRPIQHPRVCPREINIPLGFTSSTSQTEGSVSRQNKIQALLQWAKDTANIQFTGGIELRSSPESGLGWWSTRALPASSVLLAVPSSLVLAVGGRDGPMAAEQLVEDRKVLRQLPWYARMSLLLFSLNHRDPTLEGVNLQPWLDSLPKQFDTPLHWSSLEDLQYPYMQMAVNQQRQDWTAQYGLVQSILTWEQFVWGCECARSRAFSGAYSGGAFNPLIYAFTLFLVTVYVGLDLGTLEQAANGAGVVLSVSILKDFVLPKFFKQQQYIICPVIDMANHLSLGTGGEVSFEYFANAYSLATLKEIPADKEVTISYGTRSNDQLLQYYGFVEPDNPHDVYILPSLRDWDIEAIEKACGRTIAPGRLAKLDRAGLLGTCLETSSTNEEAANVAGGVVVSRGTGVDPAVVQALRALLSTEEEWTAAGGAIGNFVEPVNAENERCARLAARTALEAEVASKATTLEEDEDLLRKMQTLKKAIDAGREDVLALQFRIEKKRLLAETIDRMR